MNLEALIALALVVALLAVAVVTGPASGSEDYGNLVTLFGYDQNQPLSARGGGSSLDSLGCSVGQAGAVDSARRGLVQSRAVEADVRPEHKGFEAGS